MKKLESFNERNRYTIKASIPIITFIKRTCKKLDVEYVKYISSGSFGDAFEIKQNGIDRVLKITTDREEAKIANTLKGKDLPGIVKFHDVKRIKSKDLKRFENYLIIMDKVDPISNKRTLSQIKSIISKIVDDDLFIIPDEIKNIPNSKIKSELETIIDSLRKIGIREEVSDIQVQNLGIGKNNELILFDLSIIDFSPFDSVIDI
jgi:hypothetical protein